MTLQDRIFKIRLKGLIWLHSFQDEDEVETIVDNFFEDEEEFTGFNEARVKKRPSEPKITIAKVSTVDENLERSTRILPNITNFITRPNFLFAKRLVLF